MQSNRAVVVVLLLVLAVSAIVAWQFLGGERTTLPHPDATNTTGQADPARDLAAGGTDSSSAAAPTGGADALREAVAIDAPEDATLPAIVGQIVDAKQRPIAGAEIQCAPDGGLMPDLENFDPSEMPDFGPDAMAERLRQQASARITVASDSDGRFRLRVDGSSRTVSLRILARGHRVLDRTAPRPIDRDTDLGQLQLETGAVIAGRCLDPQGNPIANARVTRMLEIEQNLPGGLDLVMPGMDAMDAMRSGETATTDAAGNFELAHVPAGDFTLRARHADHPTAQRTGLSVASGQSLTDVIVTMARGAEIRGSVVGLPTVTRALRVMASARPDANAAAGNPMAGIFGMMGDPTEMLADMGMAVGERTVEIQRDGSFVLRGLDAQKTYRLWLAQQGSGFAGSRICSARVEAAAGSAGIELRYEAGITVTFVAVDAQSGQPIERLWVRDQLRGGDGLGDMMAFMPDSTREQTYPDGKVTVANLRPKPGQTLRLTLEAIGYAELQRDGIDLPTSGNLDLGKLSLARHPSVQVTVLSAYDDQPIAKARAQLSAKGQRGGRAPWGSSGGGGPQSAQTDDAGRCTLNVPDAGVAELKVTRNGYAPAAAELTIDSGGASDQTVRLLVGGTAEVTVHGPDQEPVASADVEHRSPNGDTNRRRTDAAGVVRFANLTPGRHEFRLAPDRGAIGFAFPRRGGNDDAPAEAAWQGLDIVDRATAALRLEQNPTAVLRGVVRENGMPLAGATVAFSEGSGSDGPEAAMLDGLIGQLGQLGGRANQGARRRATTSADGTYELTELPAGEHRLRVTHRDRAMPTTVPLRLREGDNQLDVDLDMTALQGVVLGPDGWPVEGARVTVRVVRDGAAGPDVGNMVARMMPGMNLGGPEQKSDASGAFELRGVEPGVRLEISATAKGLAPTSVEATVARGEVQRGVELRLGAAGRIEVTVADAGMFGAVTARRTGEGDDATPVMQMLQRGKGTLDGLQPGTWEVEYRGMQNRNGPAPKRTVTVAAGQTVKVEF